MDEPHIVYPNGLLPMEMYSVFVLEFKEQTEAWNHKDPFDQEFTVPE